MTIYKYPSHRKPGTSDFPYHWSTVGLFFKSWWLCLDFASLSDSLIILDIYPVEMSFVPFIISVRALPTPKRYCIHSIYRAPPSAKGNFKVATKISGRINLKISSYVRLTAPYRLSRNESLIGFHRCLFSIPLPPNTASSGLIIGTYFQSK